MSQGEGWVNPVLSKGQVVSKDFFLEMYTPQLSTLHLLWNKFCLSSNSKTCASHISVLLLQCRHTTERDWECVRYVHVLCARAALPVVASSSSSPCQQWESQCVTCSVSPRVCCEGRRADGGTVICCMIITFLLLRLIMARIQCWSEGFVRSATKKLLHFLVMMLVPLQVNLSGQDWCKNTCAKFRDWLSKCSAVHHNNVLCCTILASHPGNLAGMFLHYSALLKTRFAHGSKGEMTLSWQNGHHILEHVLILLQSYHFVLPQSSHQFFATLFARSIGLWAQTKKDPNRMTHFCFFAIPYR